ncbi:GntR family transcriptional regulator [Actinomycetospora termitidis]|uniref:GntR family transcriptional regulator n=1 Tax=Actinomycetospora termitidis TaxID=3053470 RepID=A0ABT7M7P9_9PSEU|nr:GntR family transcriptional regulator [Actinomycetospora sp. Odt1-22]MDL5155837.1 GntR family transcriptional regulator [Actinomycetospora sp. Odt1-22]
MSQDSGDSDEPPYRRVAAALRARVDDLAPGDRLPSVRAIVSDFGVASATASRALALLREEGLVESVPRVGTVVASRTPSRRRVRPRGTGPYRADVVALAVEIADADGLAGVSMRRLAAELGVPTMSAHGLVRGKDELVMAMLEEVFDAEPWPSVAVDAGWRARLEVSAHRQWAVYSRHPWAARAISLHRPQPVPALLAIAEWDLTALESVVADAERRFDLYMVLVGYVRGMAMTLAAERDAEADTGVDADWWIDHDPATARGMSRLAGPAIRRAGPYAYDLDRVFRTGLTALLDGMV